MSRVNNTIDKFGRQRGFGKTQILRGPPGIGFKLNDDGQYNIEGKRLTNLAPPSSPNDAATIQSVRKEITTLRAQIVSLLKKEILPFLNKK